MASVNFVADWECLPKSTGIGKSRVKLPLEFQNKTNMEREVGELEVFGY